MVLPARAFSCCDAASSPTRSSGETSRLSTGGSSAFPVSFPVGISLSAPIRSVICKLCYESIHCLTLQEFHASGLFSSLSLSLARRRKAQQDVQCRKDPGELWLIYMLPVDPVESLSQDHRLVWMLSSLLCSSFFKTAEAPQRCPAIPPSPVVRRTQCYVCPCFGSPRYE